MMKAAEYQSCYCMGPQPGYPLCPCQMRGLIQRDGRWIKPEQDMGPVIDPPLPADLYTRMQKLAQDTPAHDWRTTSLKTEDGYNG
jgi:hypothetical protein